MDLDAHRIYCGDPYGLAQESEDLICVDWEVHVGASVKLHLVAVAHDQVVDASWTDIGRAVGISRQSAHERWAKTLAE